MVKPPPGARLPAAGEAKRGSDGYFAYLLRQAGAATRLALDRAMADVDVTLPQFSVLTMIASYQPLSSADVARLSMLTPQTVNAIIQTLEQRGTITRRRHPVHGRILVLEITKEGASLLKRARVRADQVEGRLVALLKSDSELNLVKRWLAAIPGSVGAADVGQSE